MQDIVNVESEFMKGMIAGQISKVLKSKMGINVELQLDEFNVRHKDERIEMCIDINAKMNKRDLERIGKRYNCPQMILDMVMAVAPGALKMKFINDKIQSEVEKYIKKKTSIAIKINGLKYSNKKSKIRAHINAGAEMTEDQLRKLLTGYGLL